jgi:hypothetical protein
VDYFQATSSRQENSTQELCGELCLPAKQAADCENKVDIRHLSYERLFVEWMLSRTLAIAILLLDIVTCMAHHYY